MPEKAAGRRALAVMYKGNKNSAMAMNHLMQCCCTEAGTPLQCQLCQLPRQCQHQKPQQLTSRSCHVPCTYATVGRDRNSCKWHNNIIRQYVGQQHTFPALLAASRLPQNPPFPHANLPSHVQPSLPSCLRAFSSAHLNHEANFTLRLPAAVIMDAPEKSSLNLMCQKLGRSMRGLECCLQAWMQQACV